MFICCLSLIHGVGEIDLKDQEKENLKNDHINAPSPTKPDIESMPYLLLDLRDKDAFDQCHIIGGLLIMLLNCMSRQLFHSCTKPSVVIFDFRFFNHPIPSLADQMHQLVAFG